MRCPGCDQESSAADRYCSRCGVRLLALDPAEAQRRQLSIMFCDLVGYTRLSQRIDAEDLSAALRGFQALCSDAIETLDGQVAQLLGDGVLAYFGYPRAHEDDAVRATNAALAILEGMPALSARLEERVPALRDEPLQVRIAIHTGLVVMSEIGGPGRGELLALGQTTNLAARLQQRAEPGSVVVSDATRRLLGGAFDLAELGLWTLPGISEPVGVFRVLRAQRIQSRIDHAAEVGLTPLVGREQELSLLLDRWEQVRDPAAQEPAGPRGRAVLLRGEPGMGKSRLVYELRLRLGAESHLWLEGRSSPYHEHSAFHAVIEMIERALGFALRESTAEKLAKLDRALAAAREQGSVEPAGTELVADLLSLPHPGLDGGSRLGPEARRRHTLETLLAWLRQAAERRPVVVVIEDLHWADPSTLELVGQALEALQEMRVMLLLTARPDFETPWSESPDLVELTLHPLHRRQMSDLARYVAGGRELPAELLQRIVASADGVPLFVEELTRAMLEAELVVPSARGDRLELSRPLGQLAIPATLQDSLMARLDRLGPARAWAQLASVIGREFRRDLLEALVPEGGSDPGRALEQLTGSGILQRHEDSGRELYFFRHVMVQQTAYQSLLRTRRREIHARIARTLAERFPDHARNEPQEVARHWREAGDAEQAIEYYARAGERATARSEYAEAIAQLRQAIALMGALEPGVERDHREIELQVALGVPLIAARGQSHPEVERAYARALELCASSEKREQRPRARALWGLARFYQSQGKLDIASDLGEQLLASATEGGETDALAWAHLGLGLTAFWRGEPRRAVDELERAVALFDPPVHRAMAYAYGQDLDCTARAFAGLAWWVVGRPDLGARRAEEAIALGRDAAVALSLANALDYAAAVHGLCGDFERAAECADEAVAIASQRGLPLWLAFAKVMRAWSRGASQPGGAAIEELRATLGELAGTGAALGGPFMLALLTEALCEGDRAGEALASVEGALGLARSQHSPFWDAELERLRGEILARLAPQEPAVDHEPEACLRHAVEIARKQGADSLELRAATSLGRLLAGQGRACEARELLAPLLARFEALGEGRETRDVCAAASLLAALG